VKSSNTEPTDTKTTVITVKNTFNVMSLFTRNWNFMGKALLKRMNDGEK